MDLKQFLESATGSSTQAPVKTATNHGYATEGGAGVSPTIVGAHWFNQVAMEMDAVMSAAKEPAKTDPLPELGPSDPKSLNQIASAIKIIAQKFAKLEADELSSKLSKDIDERTKVSSGTIQLRQNSGISNDPGSPTIQTYYYRIRPYKNFVVIYGYSFPFKTDPSHTHINQYGLRPDLQYRINFDFSFSQSAIVVATGQLVGGTPAAINITYNDSPAVLGNIYNHGFDFGFSLPQTTLERWNYRLNWTAFGPS